MAKYLDAVGLLKVKQILDATYPAQTSIAPLYDNTATYYAGNFAMHDGLLYRCNTRISIAEAWNASHWDVVDVSSLVFKGTLPVSSSGGLKYVDLTNAQRAGLYSLGNQGILIIYSISFSPSNSIYATWIAAYTGSTNKDVVKIYNAMSFDASNKLCLDLGQRAFPLETNFAPAYNRSATYAVDDLCTYNGILYKCTTAKTSTEDFDPNKWTATNVAELIYGAIHSAY